MMRMIAVAEQVTQRWGMPIFDNEDEDGDGGDDDDGCGGAGDSEVGDAHRCLCGRLPSLQPSSDVAASLNQNLLSPHHL